MILNYFPRKSPIHSIDPRAKLIFTFIYIIAILVERNFKIYGILGLLILIPFFFAKLPLMKILKGIIPFLILFILTVLFHFLLTPGEVIFKLSILTGTREGIQNGLIFAIRLLLMIMASMLLGYTTSPIDLSESLSGFFRRFKSSTVREIPMIIIFTLRFIPFIIREGKRIILAGKARGTKLGFNKELFTIIFPIVNSALKRADQLALALHAKAYEPGIERASYRNYRFGFIDYLFLTYSLLPVIVLLLI